MRTRKLFSICEHEEIERQSRIMEEIKSKKQTISEIYRRGAWKNSTYELEALDKAWNDLLFTLQHNGLPTRTAIELKATHLRSVTDEVLCVQVSKANRRSDEENQRNLLEAERISRACMNLLADYSPQTSVTGPGRGSVGISFSRTVAAR